jgi:hypothetical protein
MKSIIHNIAFLGLASLLSLSANAGSVTFDATTSAMLLDGQGLALDNTFKFELGTFGGSFVPTASNTDQWWSNWKPFARADEPSGTFAPDFGAFLISATLDNLGASDSGLTDYLGNAPTFTTGEAAYLWAFDDQTVSAPTDWALVGSPSWVLPDPTSATPVTFNLSEGSPAVFGNFDPTFAGTIAGPINTIGRLQTVPEPGSVFLVAIAGLCARFRRTTRRQA